MLNLVLENEAVLLAGRRARWRLAWAAAGTAACMLFVVVLATLIDLVDFGKPADTGSSEALIPGNLASFVEWLRAFAPLMLAPLLAWRIVHGRTLKSFRLHGHGRHWSWFWRSAAAGLLVFGFANLAELIIHGDRFAAVPRGFDFLPWFTLGLAVILFQSMSEEVLFKGYLLRAWGAVFPQRWLVAMVLLVLFIALHWSNDDFSRDRGLAVLDFVLSGIVSYLVFFRTNSIAAATGLHFANNVASTLLIANLPGGKADAAFATYTDPVLMAGGSNITDAPSVILVGLGNLLIGWLLLSQRSPLVLPPGEIAMVADPEPQPAPEPQS